MSVMEEAMRLLRGYATFAYLSDIHRLAATQLGFNGSLEEAAELLAMLPDVRVEINDPLSQSRVFASSYWSPID